MKKCPFCETENKDNANKCTFCGGEFSLEESRSLQEVETEQKEEYAVFISKVHRKKAAIKRIIKRELQCDSGELKKILKEGLIRGLSIEKANRWEKLLKDECSFVKVVDATAVKEIDDEIEQHYMWRVKLLSLGQNRWRVAQFIFEYLLGNTKYSYIADEALKNNPSIVSNFKKRMFDTLCRQEAETFLSTMQSFGGDAEIVKVKRRENGWLRFWCGEYAE